MLLQARVDEVDAVPERHLERHPEPRIALHDVRAARAFLAAHVEVGHPRVPRQAHDLLTERQHVGVIAEPEGRTVHPGLDRPGDHLAVGGEDAEVDVLALDEALGDEGQAAVWSSGCNVCLESARVVHDAYARTALAVERLDDEREVVPVQGRCAEVGSGDQQAGLRRCHAPGHEQPCEAPLVVEPVESVRAADGKQFDVTQVNAQRVYKSARTHVARNHGVDAVSLEVLREPLHVTPALCRGTGKACDFGMLEISRQNGRHAAIRDEQCLVACHGDAVEHFERE